MRFDRPGGVWITSFAALALRGMGPPDQMDPASLGGGGAAAGAAGICPSSLKTTSRRSICDALGAFVCLVHVGALTHTLDITTYTGRRRGAVYRLVPPPHAPLAAAPPPLRDLLLDRRRLRRPASSPHRRRHPTIPTTTAQPAKPSPSHGGRRLRSDGRGAAGMGACL